MGSADRVVSGSNYGLLEDSNQFAVDQHSSPTWQADCHTAVARVGPWLTGPC